MRLAVFIGVCLLAGCGDSTGATGGAGGGGVGGLGGTSGTGGAGGIDLNVWPCTEQGIRDAITIGGGPHTFACDAPTIVTTQATLDVDNNVILDGEGNLIVDGGDDHTVFSLLRAGRAVFRNMTIQRGYTEGAGAGIRSFESDLIVEGCTIVDNRSLEQIGGGIYSFDGVLEIVGSTISRNEAVIGGGITCGACDLEVRQSFITDNMGGGIDNLGTTFVLDTTITGNVSSFGGGGIANLGELVLVDSVISANEGARGGGVFNAGTMSVFGTTIDGNNAEEGGGVYAFDASRNGGDLLALESCSPRGGGQHDLQQHRPTRSGHLQHRVEDFRLEQHFFGERRKRGRRGFLPRRHHARGVDDLPHPQHRCRQHRASR